MSADSQSPFCVVPSSSGEFICAGPRTREEFDRIPLTSKVGDWKPDLLDKSKECRITSKVLEAGEMHVVFQWSEERDVVQGGAA